MDADVGLQPKMTRRDVDLARIGAHASGTDLPERKRMIAEHTRLSGMGGPIFRSMTRSRTGGVRSGIETGVAPDDVAKFMYPSPQLT